MNNYKLAYLLALLTTCSCGTIDTVNVNGSEDGKTPPTIDEQGPGGTEVLDDVDSSTGGDSQSQPEFSPDKLYRGMSMGLVEDLFGSPDSITKFLGATVWVYGPDLEFCASDNQFIDCEIFFVDGKVTKQEYIDPEWMHIQSF